MIAQTPAQLVCPMGQIVPHVPLAQTWPDKQAVPQAPQLAGSVFVFTHVPAQRLWPAGHRQVPAWQL